MRVREAEIKDSAGLAEIQVDSYRTAYAGILPPAYLDQFTYEEQEQDWRELLSSQGVDILLVAETDCGEILGYALGRPGPTEIPPFDRELVALHVRRSHQRQGIGHRLIAAIARELKDRGCNSLMLWVLEGNPAHALYERLGGEPLGEKDWGGNQTYGTAVKETACGWADIRELL